MSSIAAAKIAGFSAFARVKRISAITYVTERPIALRPYMRFVTLCLQADGDGWLLVASRLDTYCQEPIAAFRKDGSGSLLGVKSVLRFEGEYCEVLCA